MHVFITGGAGFIGSHLTEYHLAKGDQVHVLDNMSTGSLENLHSFHNHPAFNLSVEDILGWKGLKMAVAWSDRIYHLAAVVGVQRVLNDPVRVMSINMAGTERLLRAVHEDVWTPQVLLTSSSEVYGFNVNSPYSEQDQLVFASGGQLRWSYALTKLADEYLGFAYHRGQGMDIKIVRLFNTVGPRQVGRYGMVLPRFVHQAVRGETITVYGDGEQTRSFCDVRDIVAALDLLAANPAAAGEVVNVGSEREISINALAQLVCQRAASRSQVEYLSYGEAYGEEFEDIRHRRPVLDKLRGLIGFKPLWSLEQTIDDLITRERKALAADEDLLYTKVNTR
jgi:UDP-glucose 4-epimerase